MVVGNGLIAKKFSAYTSDDRFLIFASGVSNSKSTIQTEYDREFNLLKEVAAKNKDKIFLYFSTCSVNDPAESNTDYTTHKRKIEKFIQSNIKDYLIFRVSNLVGKSNNANTIFNFIASHIGEQKAFDLWIDASRNLIDVDDLFKIVNHILQNNLFSNQIINIANPKSYPVKEIVEVTEKYFNNKAKYNPISRGDSFDIDVSEIKPFFKELNINFDENYLKELLIKYY